MTSGQLQGIRSTYLRKLALRDPDVWRAWIRFLTFRSDYRLLARAVFGASRSRSRPANKPAGDPGAKVEDNTNPLFATAVFQMLSTSRRILFLFPGADRLHWEFDAKFMSRHAATVQKYGASCRIVVMPQANHVFSLSRWQREMLDHCCEWLAADEPTNHVNVKTRATA
jgi:hypothetical protein